MANGTLEAPLAAEVEAHLGDCESCRMEYDLVQAVLKGIPPVPEGLEEKIQARVREEFGQAGRGAESGDPQVLPFRRRLRVPIWGLSAAAVAVLALGTSLIWDGGSGDGVQDPVLVASQDPAPEAWLWDDGMVAGAPVYDGLSDEDLEALLEDFGGGA
jgi:anti-sigma factor RsiW